jgi:signal transduction protein with GAF and PtsI domain
MIYPEIKSLRDLLINGEKELKDDEKRIDEIAEQEVRNFFSAYKAEELESYIIKEYKESIRNIYTEKVNKKRTILNNIAERLSKIESNYLIEKV